MRFLTRAFHTWFVTVELEWHRFFTLRRRAAPNTREVLSSDPVTSKKGRKESMEKQKQPTFIVLWTNPDMGFAWSCVDSPAGGTQSAERAWPCVDSAEQSMGPS
jgi:hypothetical protein